MHSIPNILLVDDDERFIKSLHAVLKLYDYECTEASNGCDAIKLLNIKHFDLALLDVQLPDISGCDILEFIKKSVKDTTAIMLTGINTVETAVKAMKLGAYDFLNKPINHELLIKTIRKGLQHHNLTMKLEVSEKRFHALAEATFEGIVIHDNFTLIEANNQFFTLFGYSARELKQGIFLGNIFTEASLRIARRHIESHVLGSYEITGVKKGGTEFPLEVNSRSINFLGKPACVCAVRDLSDRVRAENEKLVLHKKLAKAHNLKVLGQMAGSVAHDLNNILSGIVSFPELLLSQMHESDKFYADIKKIQEAGKRAAAVVADIVVLARGGSLQTTVENINDIILSHLSSIEHSERMAQYRNVTIQTSLQKNLQNTYCSNQHIHKILLNLIGNALEAIQENGLIRVTTQNCKLTDSALDHASTHSVNYVKLTLADNGPGIPQKDLDHIFEPFYTSKKSGKSGTGLGLSIVWNAVHEHNGWLEVKNNNPGVIFEIYLPATFEKTYSKEAVGVNRPLQGNGETILLIDDESEQNEIMGKLIGSLGYKTYSATSGEEGLAFLKKQAVDLVLLDMIMGDGLNGRETYERILQVKPGQKAIIISGYSKNEDVLRTKSLGISKFLEKPVTLSKLGLAIKQSLSSI